MRGKAFLNCKSIDLFSKLSLTYGGNVNCYKVFINLFLYVYRNREHPGNFQNKSINSPFNWVSKYIIFLPKLKGKERLSLEGCKKGHHIAWDYSNKHFVDIRDKKSPSFYEIWNNPTPPLFLLDFLTNKHCRAWRSIMNLWIDSRTYQK